MPPIALGESVPGAACPSGPSAVSCHFADPAGFGQEPLSVCGESDCRWTGCCSPTYPLQRTCKLSSMKRGSPSESKNPIGKTARCLRRQLRCGRCCRRCCSRASSVPAPSGPRSPAQIWRHWTLAVGQRNWTPETSSRPGLSTCTAANRRTGCIRSCGMGFWRRLPAASRCFSRHASATNAPGT